MFDYDWFHGGGLARQVDEARRRCAQRKFPEADAATPQPEYATYSAELTTRVFVCLKEGFTYELKSLVDIGVRSALTFESVAHDDNYAAGTYVVVLPFEEIARIEVFAVHPSEQPVETLKIGGFRSSGSESAH